MNPLDAELHPFGALLDGLGWEEAAEAPEGLSLDHLVLDLPVELAVDAAVDGAVTVALSPPRQPIVTTVMPVFHRLRLTVVSRARH